MAVLGLNKQDQNFSSNVEMKSKSFGIGDASAIIDILRNRMYSMPIQTLVQEYICNGRDASIEAGHFGKKPILITAPTKLSCEFRVRDFGVGLSQERVENVFTLYGNSTKRDSNTQIGGYGLGAKSAWAYTDSFTVVSFYNGTKTTYLCHVGKDNVGSMDILNTETTKEQNGVEIIVTVKPDDIKKFNHAIKRVLSFWNEDSYKLNVIFSKEECLYKDELTMIYGQRVDVREDDKWHNRRGAFIVVDDVIFPLPKSIEDKITHNLALYIHVKTGVVDVAPSREVIIDNNKVTQLLSIYNEHLAKLNREISNQKDIESKVMLGDKYKTLLEKITFPITKELTFTNGELEVNNARELTRRLTNKHCRLVIDTHEYDYTKISKPIDKKTVILIATIDTKNIPSKVKHFLKNTRTFNRNEYAICLPENNLPKYILDKVTVIDVASLPLPPKQKAVKYASNNDCKKLEYSSYYNIRAYDIKLDEIDDKNAFKVPFQGWKDNYKLKSLLYEDNTAKAYAMKKEDFDASELPTMEEFLESKAKIESKKIGNFYSKDLQGLSKLVSGIDFPTFGESPREFYLTKDENESHKKLTEQSLKLIDLMRKEFPLTIHLSSGNIKEVAEYITLKQKSKVKLKKSA